MHLEFTDHVWTLWLGGWSRNLFRREVGSCRRKAGAWRDKNRSTVLPRAPAHHQGPRPVSGGTLISQLAGAAGVW